MADKDNSACITTKQFDWSDLTESHLDHSERTVRWKYQYDWEKAMKRVAAEFDAKKLPSCYPFGVKIEAVFEVGDEYKKGLSRNRIPLWEGQLPVWMATMG